MKADVFINRMSSGLRLETILKLHEDKGSFTRSNVHVSDDQRNSPFFNFRISAFPALKGNMQTREMFGVDLLWKTILMTKI